MFYEHQMDKKMTMSVRNSCRKKYRGYEKFDEMRIGMVQMTHAAGHWFRGEFVFRIFKLYLSFTCFYEI